MEKRITDILRANFNGAVVNLNWDTRNERINGSLLWAGFDGHDFLWRQNEIYRVLRRELGKEATVISHIFTYTPNEYEQMMAA